MELFELTRSIEQAGIEKTHSVMGRILKNILYLGNDVYPAIIDKETFDKAEEIRKKLRVAAYCRVSTETKEQNLSYDVQVAHYTEFIKKNTEWEFAGIFADEYTPYGQNFI